MFSMCFHSLLSFHPPIHRFEIVHSFRLGGHDLIGGFNYYEPPSCHSYLGGGIPTPLKNMKVSWDDGIPNIWKNNIYVPNHQPDLVVCFQTDLREKKFLRP